MKLLWPVLLVLFRTLYFLYSVWCLLFPVAAVWFIATLSQNQTLLGIEAGVWKHYLLGAFALFATGMLLVIYARRSSTDPNPFQSAFMSWFGTLRGYWNVRPGDMVKLRLPSGYLVENPQAYRIGGRDIQQILKSIQPGDILLRAYDGYVDGFMIRKASVCTEKDMRPGWFTHAAIYVGELTGADRVHVPAHLRDNASYFQEGSHMLVHAMAKGVHSQDLLTFCRCDYLTVLRVKPGKNNIDVAAAIQAARQSALEKIGDSYDFDASDTTRFSRFSCSELVYYCLRSVRDKLQMQPIPHALFPLSPLTWKVQLLKRVTIVPDDFYTLVQHGTMECVWVDAVSARATA